MGNFSVLDEFAALASGDQVPLDRAALCIAAHCRGEPYEPQATLDELDRLAGLLAGSTPPEPSDVVNLLFAQEGFGGNRGRFADPANSYLDQVVARRMGIPITLAVVTIEVARRAGLSLHSVGMPGHFLVGTNDSGTLIDAFDGRIIDRDGARAIFERFGSRRAFDEAFLRPTPPPAVLARMLNNLRAAHTRSVGMTGGPSLVAVLELLTRLVGCPPTEHVRLGVARAAAGRPDLGARGLEEAAAGYGEQTAERMQRAARRLWAKLN